ncbi:hypothetical protein DICVIV_00528 [Dictyocaulus viviparus]|uniref:Uncharacterized protein n=1 Tax=Dictyocaulus viviparus TaxID=29172 RepID=A0A0D8YAM2_DICVI|nr:hypothetical protein DICVIV_00528 [Dictyocaulus viviparus]
MNVDAGEIKNERNKDEKKSIAGYVSNRRTGYFLSHAHTQPHPHRLTHSLDRRNRNGRSSNVRASREEGWERVTLYDR